MKKLFILFVLASCSGLLQANNTSYGYNNSSYYNQDEPAKGSYDVYPYNYSYPTNNRYNGEGTIQNRAVDDDTVGSRLNNGPSQPQLHDVNDTNQKLVLPDGPIYYHPQNNGPGSGGPAAQAK